MILFTQDFLLVRDLFAFKFFHICRIPYRKRYACGASSARETSKTIFPRSRGTITFQNGNFASPAGMVTMSFEVGITELYRKQRSINIFG